MPSLDIEVILVPGDNVIDLPALPAGNLDYTCSMGMYYGSITVQPAGAPAERRPTHPHKPARQHLHHTPQEYHRSRA